MKGFVRNNQYLSLCGLNCKLCPMSLAGHCSGCGVDNQSCKIARCSIEHEKIEYCFQCGSFPCSNYPECKFTLAEHFRKKKLTKTNVKELLEGKETLVKGIKTKDRKSYNAVVKIGEKGYIDFISFSK